jgi:transcriptional regulator GlxA family with amidase domain
MNELSMFLCPASPSQSRRAADMLIDRLDEPWSVDRLASALGFSSRTLHRVVRRELGLSPMLLLRKARLAQARAELDAPGPGATVTTVALDCGFTHLGRFAREYARQFGEPPSETLRRARRREAEAATGIAAAASSAA